MSEAGRASWHAEAIKLRAEGVGRREIAKRLGKSLNSVTYLFSAKTRASQNARSRRYRAAKKAEGITPAGRRAIDPTPQPEGAP